MKHLICMAFLLAAITSFADDPIEIQFVGVSPPVSGCACQAVNIEVKARDWDVTTSGVGWDDLIFHVYPAGSGWTATAAPWRDEDGWWHQTFTKTFASAGEYPPGVDDYIFRALDLDIFHGENDVDDKVVRTKVIVQDHYEKGTDISCTIDAPANGAGYARNAAITCSVTASDVDKKNCQDIGDTVTYLWSATGGQFSGSTTNSTATWIAPPGAGTYTISVRVDDADDPVNPPYCGLRSDDQVTESVDVTVGIIHVSKSGNDTDGLTWGKAKRTVQGGLNAASSGGEVWVAAGTYDENITLKAGVGLYGGFEGISETYREQRDWRSHVTTLYGQGTEQNPASVVTSPAGAANDTIIDGFTIKNGSAVLGGGVYCAGSSPTIANNTITSNSATGFDNSSGGGIYCSNSFARIIGNKITSNTAGQGGASAIYCGSNSNVSIINNVIDHNATSNASYGAVCLDSSSGTIESNTVAENSGQGYAILIVGSPSTSPPTIANNIVAFNPAGVCSSADTILKNNDVYYNPAANGEDYCAGLAPDGSNISVPPLFVDLPSDDYHLAANSPCRDAADDTYTEWLFDIDMEPRIQDFASDIGADEIPGCGRVDVTYPEYGTPGQTVTITAHAVDLNGQPTPGVTICFSVSGGVLTEINGSSPPENGCGYTNSSGNVTAVVTRDTPGTVAVTLSRTCGSEQPTRTIHIPFAYYWHVGFLYDLCTDTGPRADTDAYLSRIDSVDPYVTYGRISGTSFTAEDLSSFNTIFVVMPTAGLGENQLTALNIFVQSGRHKRIVLVGEWNPAGHDYNVRLNDIAVDIGADTRFSTGACCLYDDYTHLCNVVSGHYLTTGVTGLLDNRSDTFETVGSQAHPLAYLDQTWPQLLPWVVEEDSDSAGSRVFVHDSTFMLWPWFGDDCEECDPNRNFRFVRNLCTIFPE